MAYYREYFDLSSQDAIRRMARTVWPFLKESFVEAEPKADLYVPLWTYCTLVITMSTFGSIVSAIDDARESSSSTLNLSFDYSKVEYCAGVLGFFFFINPAFFCIFFKCKGSPIGLAQLLCMVGYSFVPFIPVSFLFVTPYAIFRVAILMTAACLGMHFLYRNMGDLADKYLVGYTYFVRAYMIVIQIILIVVIYFVIFS
ncbi:MAG: hypothetical protein P4M11_11995 [Candidatus Pacebacteria bacterium]|nr:hypothetical protein [Candidatus Paceibacterota bacterium]